MVRCHSNHSNHSRKHNSNHLSVHQRIRSAIRDSQQPTSPIGFVFLKLPPPPCAVLLLLLLYDTYIYIYMRVCVYIIHYIWCVSIKTICVQRICIYNTVIRYMMLYVHMYTVSYWKNPSRFKDSQQDSRTERTNGTAHTDSKQTTHVSKAMPWNQLKNRAT